MILYVWSAINFGESHKMQAETTSKKQEELNSFILDLAKNPLDNQDKVKAKTLLLKDIYSEGFHHLYSQFFPLITNIFDENDYSSDLLVTNLEAIKVFAEEDYSKKDNVIKEGHVNAIRKLCDHINLEVARMSYNIKNKQQAEDITTLLAESQEEVKKVRAELQKSQEELAHSQDELKDTSNALKEATDKIKDSQGQIVAVLSIFAAIVVAFAGGIGLFGNSIASSGNTPILNLLLIIFACGIVLIDAITALIYAVSKLVGKSIFSKCVNEECNCKNKKGTPLCNSLDKIRKKLPFVFWVNVILLVIIGILIILYGTNVKWQFM